MYHQHQFVCLSKLEKPATEEGGKPILFPKEPVSTIWSPLPGQSSHFLIVVLLLLRLGSSPSSHYLLAFSGSFKEGAAAEPVSKNNIGWKAGDPKRKIHKPVKGVLRLEIEKLQSGLVDSEKSAESRSVNGDMPGHLVPGTHFSQNCPSYRTDGRPSMSRKRNLFIRVELRQDDGDIRKPPFRGNASKGTRLWHFRKGAHTQVAVGARVACYHDEIKVSLPAIWTPMHHLLFTFFHVDLQTKIEVPKP
ncbi:UNVERIFIED_CONTAM: Guanine nucleotide exchange factor SPIKE 1, partial [Sesamum latifolium]